MTTLGDLFNVSITHLTAAADETWPVAGHSEQAALTSRIDDLLQQISRGLGPTAYTPVPTTEERNLTLKEKNLDTLLAQASMWLRRAQQYLEVPPDGPTDSAGTRIEAATQAVVAVRDTIGSHLGPDRSPLTPYAYLLRHNTAFDYLTDRYAELSRAAGQVVHHIAQSAEHPGAREAFEAARTSLDRAAVLTRYATRTAPDHFDAFPLALPVIPVQAAPGDPTNLVTAQLAEDSERLSRAAYAAMHDRDEHRLSGSDLKQLSYWTSASRLLAGRVLRHAANGLASDQESATLQQAAGVLRKSATAWSTASDQWSQIVDTTDPREHPMLPPPGYPQIKLGRVMRMPSRDPHPAVVIARTTAWRTGQLLFGMHWTPDDGPQTPRPSADILADAGGPGPLAAALYRLPSTGWQMAAAAPWVIKRAGATLVCDIAEHRPPTLDRSTRFYPVHPRVVDALTRAYSAVMAAEQSSAGALLDAARQAGTAVPRAMLDASAHRTMLLEQTSAPKRQVQPAQRNLPRAAVPQELMVGRRPGLRR
ncbi:hypothetical protein [Streptomyces sp. NPDC047718]|uniref:hypothetical protein n=1 Tax=Streptomyces sp. NPDC047718 TaxID=3155479 RepID=UPI00340925B0